MSPSLIYSSVIAPTRSGYEWITAYEFSSEADIGPVDIMRHRCLVLKTDSDVRGQGTYDIFTEPGCSGLFKNFAALDGSEGAILKFAERYGTLPGRWGERVPEDEVAENPPPKTNKALSPSPDYEDVGPPGATFTSVELYVRRHGINFATDLEVWLENIGELRSLVMLWELILADDVENLDRCLVQHVTKDEGAWLGGKFDPSLVEGAPIDIPLPSIDYRPHRDDLEYFGIDQFKIPDDLIVFGWICLKHRLRSKVLRSSELRWTETGLGLTIEGHTLLDAMWLQFASAVSDAKQYQSCANCGDFFEIAPTVGRKGKTFCSSACRTATYRARKKAQEAKEESK